MTKKNVNITLRASEADIEAIASFNLKNNLTKLDLKHLPFNEFKFEYKPRENKDSALDKQRLTLLAKMLGVNDKAMDTIIKGWEAKDKVLMSEVTIFNNVIHMRSSNLFVAKIDFKSSEVKVSDVYETVKDLEYKADSSKMQEIVNSNHEEKENFAKFIVNTFTELLRVLVYITADKKITIKRNELCKISFIVNRKQKKSKNGKKLKGVNVSLIKNYIYEMPRERVLSNIQKNTLRQYERQTEQWFVKGHLRTYPNGNQVWIKPTIRKGKRFAEYGSDLNKTYIVK